MRGVRGISLMEFLVASLLFLIVVVAILTLMPFSAVATAHSRARIQADLVATSVIDEYRAKSFSILAIQAPQARPAVVMENGREFVPEVELRASGTVPVNKILELRVRVSWTDTSGDKSLTRAVLLSNVGSQ